MKEIPWQLFEKIPKNVKKIEIWGRVPITFESRNLQIKNFSWIWVALRWKSARNTSFRS